MRRRSCLGCLGRLFIWTLSLSILIAGAALVSLLIFPPFGDNRTARILLVGLDEMPREGGTQRSDTVMLLASHLDGSGTTLLSVPRDAYVHTPIFGPSKINAAYALGKISLLQRVLAQPTVLDADLPYYAVFDSRTVRAVIDALGGVEVNVPRRMDYDDKWGDLHIHLKPGRQLLTGEQAVGYLRWRKNNRGRSGDDFERTERQRELLRALSMEFRDWRNWQRFPEVYRAFRKYSQTNLTLQQLIILGLTVRQVHSTMVPATPMRSRGISYVNCDWSEGQRLWHNAIGE